MYSYAIIFHPKSGDTGQSLCGVVGTPAYVAPEVLLGEYSEKVDIWSAGVLLHALLLGVLPFQGSSLEACFESIKNVDLDFNGGLWLSVSQPARDLIARMLTRDVSARPSADDILKHPWISFYADPPLKTLTIKSPSKNRRLASHNITRKVVSEVDSNRVQSTGYHYRCDDSDVNLLTSSSCKVEEDSGLVDSLAVAISCMKISESKRVRICNSPNPVSHEHSSNLKVNLCAAF
ncbi:hypothetical protein KSS87_000299 [Heliosperma pusillum]|nr:hypothetical protein KSS87_000299 [Heliosperma pusillum]